MRKKLKVCSYENILVFLIFKSNEEAERKFLFTSLGLILKLLVGEPAEETSTCAQPPQHWIVAAGCAR